MGSRLARGPAPGVANLAHRRIVRRSFFAITD
jgi:hypothetical protein